MFKIKRRNALIGSLVLVLCFISYLNYAINKYSLLETSTEFEKYEVNKLAEIDLEEVMSGDTALEENNSEEMAFPVLDQGSAGDEETAVVDSSGNAVKEVVQETAATIQSNIMQQKNIKRVNYFIEARLNTGIEREKMISLLNEIINNQMTDETNRKAAGDAKMKLIDTMNKEKIIENLIKAKGFEDALVFITDNSVNVIVEIEKLTDSDMAKILDIVLRETNVPIDNVKVLNKF
ncbi:stage III sporulation protein AH [Geosporobacter subterraneus DSM 17957]|uniref:Stage III sporulation protein AH n=1 Tax=Geosporobacter subterraneus DSM 17957 TaxID=1121919 RepID=A0A1M6C363_9FIRM|nr:SpoIIIAH-like family protein [Geosporobacter subterraneus]SHI55392.1 stage III sporulation protein AH [Geosporobacter subterraneus DSM 17957]